MNIRQRFLIHFPHLRSLRPVLPHRPLLQRRLGRLRLARKCAQLPKQSTRYDDYDSTDGGSHDAHYNSCANHDNCCPHYYNDLRNNNYYSSNDDHSGNDHRCKWRVPVPGRRRSFRKPDRLPFLLQLRWRRCISSGILEWNAIFSIF